MSAQCFLIHPLPPTSILCVGPLAQLVEQLTLNQRVRSSSLRRPTKFFKHLRGLCVKTISTFTESLLVNWHEDTHA